MNGIALSTTTEATTTEATTTEATEPSPVATTIMPRFSRLKGLVKRLSISSSSADSEKFTTTSKTLTAVSLDDNDAEDHASHASKSTKWTTVESRDSSDDDEQQQQQQQQQRASTNEEERKTAVVPIIVVTEESAWEAGAEVSYDDDYYWSHSEEEDESSPIPDRVSRDFESKRTDEEQGDEQDDGDDATDRAIRPTVTNRETAVPVKTTTTCPSRCDSTDDWPDDEIPHDITDVLSLADSLSTADSTLHEDDDDDDTTNVKSARPSAHDIMVQKVPLLAARQRGNTRSGRNKNLSLQQQNDASVSKAKQPKKKMVIKYDMEEASVGDSEMDDRSDASTASVQSQSSCQYLFKAVRGGAVDCS